MLESEVFTSEVVGLESEAETSLYANDCLFIYERARVRAPAIWVVVVVETSCSVVLDIKLRREFKRVFSMSANCLYLFASLGGP